MKPGISFYRPLVTELFRAGIRQPEPDQYSRSHCRRNPDAPLPGLTFQDRLLRSNTGVWQNR